MQVGELLAYAIIMSRLMVTELPKYLETTGLIYLIEPSMSLPIAVYD